ncbi:MAG: helix-turn-helix transcriptional regulator [Spirochaetes bacterium]|nr:helix-turn-helix transcriptional regulator [Spirochaetota bacterium]
MDKPEFTETAQACIYFHNGYVLFLGKSTDTAVHSHHMFQIFIGLKKEFRLFINGKWIKSRLIIADADVSHQFDGNNEWHALLLIDPETDTARKLKQKIKNNAYIEPDFSLIEKTSDRLIECCEKKCFAAHASGIINELITSAVDEEIISAPKDERILRIISYINTTQEISPEIKNLAEMIHLSKSRLVHLFTIETGIPLRRYFLWRKLINAVNHIIRGMDFTDAAFAAGFSDSAHLSRTFKKMFGVTLLNLFKNYSNSLFIQVITDNSDYIQ